MHLEPETIKAMSDNHLQTMIDKTECLIEETLADDDATITTMEILHDNIINLVLEQEMRIEQKLIEETSKWKQDQAILN